MRIFKYPLFTGHGITTTLKIPVNAKLLTIQEQHGITQLWVMLNPLAENVSRSIICYGTGHEIFMESYRLRYIATTKEGPFIWHFFEETL